MAATIFTGLSNLRQILSTETDADSPLTETLFNAIRYMGECLQILTFSTGDTGYATGDPVTDTLTDTNAAYDADEHNGRTLLITSGAAVGNFYTIDDTTETTLVCTGDDLAADGVVAGDYYEIFYDLLTHSSGHTHDNINSAVVVLADDQVTQAKMADEAVGYPQIKDGTGSASAVIANTAYAEVTAQDFCFAWNHGSSGGHITVGTASSDSGNTVARAQLFNNSGIQLTYVVRWRYITASDKPFLYSAQDGDSGNFISLWLCDDPPPCLWYKDKLPDGFRDWPILEDPKFWKKNNKNICCFNLKNGEKEEIDGRAAADKLSPVEILNAKYEYDDESKLFKTKNLLTV